MNRINVLFLIRSWAFGGSHTIVLLLMRHLPTDRFNVLCVPYDAHTDGDAQFIEQAEKRGLSVAPERIPWKSRRNWSPARGKVLELIRKYDVQLLHTHDPHSNTMIGIGRDTWPCACVASAYGWWDTFFPIRRRVYQWIEREYALPHFDRVVTVSQHMKGRILRGPTPEERIDVIHTGMDPSLVSGGDRVATRTRLGIPDDAFVVGTVSRLSVEKGHRYLIEAVARSAASIPNLHLLVVGNGPIRGELESQVDRLEIRGRVTFAGFFDDLPGAFAAMDVFAQPSIEQEGFPTSVLEAQAAGLPVLASDIGGTRETLAVDSTGVLVSPRDVSGLGEKLKWFASDEHRRQSMARAAAERVATQFTIDGMIARIVQCYDDACARHARGR